MGQRLSIHFGPPEGIHAEIVGVDADVRPALDSRTGDYIYMHYPQGRQVAQMQLVIRPDARSRTFDASALSRAVRSSRCTGFRPRKRSFTYHSLRVGANQGQVLAMVLGASLKLTAIGLLTGVLGELALTRLPSTLLYGVEPTDSSTFAVVILLLLAAAAAASYIPARRAARIDPVIALRHE